MRFFSICFCLFALGGACASKNAPTDVKTHEHSEQDEHAHAKDKHAHGKGHAGHMRFDDAEKWSKVFENSERDAWQKPDVVLGFMKISENMSVADIGSATGYFDVRIAKAFPSVRMLGVDVEQSLVDFLNKRASDEGLENLSSRVCAFDDAKLDANTQRVLIVDTWHHIEKRVAYLEKLKGYLAKDAAVVIVDFKDVELPFGGPPRAMRLSADEVTKTFVEAGFILQERDDEGLPYQYMLRFVLPE